MACERQIGRRRSWLAGTLLGLVLALVARAEPAAPRVLYLAGDSTLAIKREERRPETGWGEALPAFFAQNRLRVENRAVNGRSTRTFLEEGRWTEILDALQPGDQVFIQFGHNDEVPSKASFTPPEEYRANLVRFVGDVRERAATPVLLTPIARRRFDSSGRAQETHAEYAPIVRGVAAELEVALLDLDRDSKALLQSLGSERSKRLFLILAPGEHPNFPEGIEDNTHLSPAGAEAIAQLAVASIQSQRLELANDLRQSLPQITRALAK